MSEFMDFWRHYADFKGKTSIRGFWVAFLIWCAIGVFLLISLTLVAAFVLRVETQTFTDFARSRVFCVYGLPSIVPLTSITVRRLRDAGYSAKSFFWLLIPGIGAIAFLVRLCSATKTE